MFSKIDKIGLISVVYLFDKEVTISIELIFSFKN